MGVLGKSAANTPDNSPEIQSIAGIFTASIARIAPKTAVTKTVAEASKGQKMATVARIATLAMVIRQQGQ